MFQVFMGQSHYFAFQKNNNPRTLSEVHIKLTACLQSKMYNMKIYMLVKMTTVIKKTKYQQLFVVHYLLCELLQSNNKYQLMLFL